MAFNHINFNRQSPYGQILYSSLKQMESADDAQRDVRSLILTMIDGDGSQISMFDEVVKQFGFADWTAGNLVTDPQRTAARNAWLQIDSAYNKTSGDGSVSGVRSARDQLFDFLRQ